MITLNQLIPAIELLGLKREHIINAIDELKRLSIELDDVEVKGREKVDTLLGCMMAIDALIGEDGGMNGR